MKSLLPILMVAILAMAAMPTAGAEESKLRKLLQGSQSGIQKPSHEVVRTAEAWDKLWKSHRSQSVGAPSMPPRVDWAKEMVLAAFMGARPTGGYAVTIEDAREEKGKLVVTVRERKPGPGDIVTQSFTSPFHMVAVPKYDLPVEWHAVEK